MYAGAGHPEARAKQRSLPFSPLKAAHIEQTPISRMRSLS